MKCVCPGRSYNLLKLIITEHLLFSWQQSWYEAGKPSCWLHVLVHAQQSSIGNAIVLLFEYKLGGADYLLVFFIIKTVESYYFFLNSQHTHRYHDGIYNF